eukprot:COSAG01_NODE_23221_length_823_cov_1.182320_1_plen_82_part_00
MVAVAIAPSQQLIALGLEAAKTAVDSGALFLGRMKPCAYDDEPNVQLLVPELAGDSTSGAVHRRMHAPGSKLYAIKENIGQ